MMTHGCVSKSLSRQDLKRVSKGCKAIVRNVKFLDMFNLLRNTPPPENLGEIEIYAMVTFFTAITQMDNL